jgi:transcription antitermination factor NusG
MDASNPDEQAARERWFACYTRARHEKRVAALLRERDIESYLPLVSRISQWKDRRREVEWPMFPSYVFARIEPAELHRIVTLAGIAAIVRTNGAPVLIRDEDIANVRRFAAALRRGGVAAEPVPYLEEGQWVEVCGGPLEGVRGMVVQRRTRRRVLVGLKAIGQALEVDVDVASLRAVEGP